MMHEKQKQKNYILSLSGVDEDDVDFSDSKLKKKKKKKTLGLRPEANLAVKSPLPFTISSICEPPTFIHLIL
jgi:hypothetical protein